MKKNLKYVILSTIITTIIFYLIYAANLVINIVGLGHLKILDSKTGNFLIGILQNNSISEKYYDFTINFINNINMNISVLILVIMTMVTVLLLILLIINYYFVEKFIKTKKISSTLFVIITSLSILYLIFLQINQVSVLGMIIRNFSNFNIFLINFYFVLIVQIVLFIYSLYQLIQLIKKEKVSSLEKNFSIYIKPIFIFIIVVLILKLFLSLIEQYTITYIIQLYDSSIFIKFTDIVNIPFSENLNTLLPQNLVDFFSQFGVKLNFSLQDKGLTSSIINSLFDRYILEYIDMFIKSIITNIVNNYFFNDLIFYILGIIIAVITYFSNIISKKYENILNILGMLLLVLIMYKIDGFILTITSYALYIGIFFILYVFMKKYDIIKNIKRIIESR